MADQESRETPASGDAKTATSPLSCRECKLWDEVKQRVRITELLESALDKMALRLQDDDFKPSLSDYLKLMQLEKEFAQEQVKEIKVTWVVPAPSPEPGK